MANALIEFLSHGLRYAFPTKKGSMVRGVPTAAAELLKSRLLEDKESPRWSGRMHRKMSAAFRSPPMSGALKSVQRDSKLYSVPALCDVICSGGKREHNLAAEPEKEING